jgi:ADP-heptose:LPS heptosyltransferase
MAKFLVIRFSSIGDIVLTTPVVRSLKTQIQGAEVHFLTKPAFRSVVAGNPYIDKVITLEESIHTTLEVLKAEQYDHIIDLHHNLRTLRVKRALGVPAHSFNKLNTEKWLLVNLKLNRLPEVHIVDRYMETVSGFGVVNDTKGLDFYFDAADEVNLNTLPAPFNSGYYAFVIGAKHATKRLPASTISEIIRSVKLPVLLLGGPEDQVEAASIASESSGMAFNAAGKFSLKQSASLVRQSRFVITHDTGLMHIASAFRKKIISVWGNTVPEFGMTPYLPAGQGESRIFEVKGLNCRPCSKIGYDRCPKGHFKCMLDQDLVSLTALARNWW